MITNDKNEMLDVLNFIQKIFTELEISINTFIQELLDTISKKR